ncbi:MAG TPA: hypothetical protein PLZ51_11545 [Aggregatilineales bacterium]|nr:hypothetical protein [Aggregatilineales bacterium]
MTDINFGFMTFQLLNFAILIAWLVLLPRALKYLRDAHLSEGVRLIWVLLAIFVPLLGVLAVLNVRPSLDKAQTI